MENTKEVKSELEILENKIREKRKILNLPSDKLKEKLEPSRVFQSMLEGREVHINNIIDILKSELRILEYTKGNKLTQLDNLIAIEKTCN